MEDEVKDNGIQQEKQGEIEMTIHFY